MYSTNMTKATLEEKAWVVSFDYSTSRKNLWETDWQICAM
jgi:hypothetical protein